MGESNRCAERSEKYLDHTLPLKETEKRGAKIESQARQRYNRRVRRVVPPILRLACTCHSSPNLRRGYTLQPCDKVKLRVTDIILEAQGRPCDTTQLVPYISQDQGVVYGMGPEKVRERCECVGSAAAFVKVARLFAFSSALDLDIKAHAKLSSSLNTLAEVRPHFSTAQFCLPNASSIDV